MILRRVHDTNWKAKGEPERVFTVSFYRAARCSDVVGKNYLKKYFKTGCLPSFSEQVTNIKTPQTQEDEFIEIQSDTGTAFQRWTVRKMTMLQQV